MKTCGIIAEYNPFHYGHKYQIERAKEITGSKIVAVMSGSFVQRGEPAIFSKQARTRAALLSEVDLILELPVYYALGSAGYFAEGAVKTLAAAGVCELCFGSESGDIDLLYKTAEILSSETTGFKEELSKALSLGFSFPAARQKALSASGYTGDPAFFGEPNNILGIEYCKAIITGRFPTKPFTIKRRGAGYHDSDISMEFPSASAIRRALASGITDVSALCPKEADKCFREERPVFLDQLTIPLKQRILTLGKQGLAEIEGVTEGLENLILEAFPENSVTGMIERIKSKRYTYSSISRMLARVLLDIKKNDFETLRRMNTPPYIRILGFSRDSEALVGEICKQATVPVVTNLKNAALDAFASLMLQKEIDSTDIRNLAAGAGFTPQSERREPLVIV